MKKCLHAGMHACIILVVGQEKTLLRKLRRDRELSLDLLHVKTGINVSTLSRVERRLMTPSEDVRKRLEKYFKVPADQLLNTAA